MRPMRLMIDWHSIDDALTGVGPSTLRHENIRFAPPIDIAMVGDPTAPRTDDD